jgi:hypothetical protein
LIPLIPLISVISAHFLYLFLLIQCTYWDRAWASSLDGVL